MSAPLRTVPDVLARFDTSFSEFAAAFDDGQYVMWLGSGISHDKVPSVGELIERVIEHLRSNIAAGEPECPYRTALGEVLRLAGLTSDELESIDFATTINVWPLRERVLATLVTKYSHVLDVLVGDDNPADYLVWTGLDVPNTYGSPSLVPDVEHYCIGILMLEGLVASAITANWDGLLERALAHLTPAFSSLVRVVVRPDDFRNTGPRMEVIKFHGCAVHARDDESRYRDLLIAREEQISGWTEQPNNKAMRKHLEVLYTDRLTLMIGLSAQDANLHTVFAGAIQDLARPWPSAPPAVVLSEEHLESYHRNLLKLTYGSNHQGNAGAIAQSALLGAYGKPTLLALVLSSFTGKLRFLVEHVLGSTWAVAEVKQLRADLDGLRNVVAAQADGDRQVFIERLIDVVSLTLQVFRTGRSRSVDGGRYEPLSDRPIAQAILNPDFPRREFGWLGVALALVGRGHQAGHWSTVPGDRKVPAAGVLRLVSKQREARVFFVKDAATLTQLELDEAFDDTDGDVFVVMANEEPPISTRSPRTHFGRIGKVRTGKFNVAASVAETTTAEDLFESFKLAGGF